MLQERPSGIRRNGTRGRRRTVVVLGFSFAQWIVTAATATRIQSAENDGSRSLIEPAEYAYAIWAPIFALSSAFGVWQALPAHRDSIVARQIGWPMAVAFATMVGWSVAYARRRDWLAQLLLLACWAVLATAFFRVVDEDRVRPLSPAERWFVALPIAPFLGWVTAANAVSLHTQLVRRGGLPAAGTPSIAGGGTLLGTALAAGLWLIRGGRSAPIQLWGTYGLTLIWALTAIVVKQRAVNPAIAGIAGAGILGVAAAAAAGGGQAGARQAAAAPA
jgi:hypothetical protein